jgi:branched-chain amino acid transport system ATP-binding protein
MTELLTVVDLEVAYSGVPALRGVSLNVAEGELVALLGSNGGGKSTLLGALMGLVRSSAGQISFAGKRLNGRPTAEIAAQRIAMVPEGRGVLAGMTVRDNLLMGAYGFKISRRKMHREFDEVLDLFPILREKLDDDAKNLSGGQKQMLLIARCLVSRPRLLVLDEPSLGLAPLIVRDVFDLVAQQARSIGLAVLVAEQNARAALRTVDRGYVLERGQIVADGSAQDLRDSNVLTAAYLGASALERPKPNEKSQP